MNAEILDRAWEKVRDGKTLSPDESLAIRENERAKAIKAGVIYE